MPRQDIRHGQEADLLVRQVLYPRNSSPSQKIVIPFGSVRSVTAFPFDFDDSILESRVCDYHIHLVKYFSSIAIENILASHDFFSLVRHAQLVEVCKDFYVGLGELALSEGRLLTLSHLSSLLETRP